MLSGYQTFTPILQYSLKIFQKIWTKQDMYSKKNQFYYSSQLHIYFLKDSFASYVYVGFQFSKHGRYAQKIYISNFQVYCLIKNLQQ